MLLKKKTRTGIITLFLLFSLLFINFNDNVHAEEPFDSDTIKDLIDILRSLVDFNDKLNPHPFRYVGIWESSRSLNIEGDMEFELYFSAPILTQIQLLGIIDFQDYLKIDVYHINSDGLYTLIENGNKTIKLEPETQEYIQKYIVKLEDIQITIYDNEYLAFVIELEYSEKPVASFVEKRFDTTFITRLERIVNILKQVEDPSLQELAALIDITLENLSALEIGGDEFGALVNVLFSSAFYYGSVDHPSSVKFYNDISEEINVYFQRGYSDFQYDLYSITAFPFEKIANETKPTTTVTYAWPPILTDIDEIDSFENISTENEIVNWLIIWALYTIGGTSGEIDTDRVSYYLTENGKLTIEKPIETDRKSIELLEEPRIWTTSDFERNQILTNISAYLYIHYSKILTIGKVRINTSLKKNGIIIATDEEDLDRTNLFELIQRGPDVPTKFNFDNFDTSEEIWYTDNLSLEVSYINKPFFGSFRPVNIIYGSDVYPSKIVFTLKETDNINIGDLKDKEVYSGGSAHYIVNITSTNSKDYNDTVIISAGVKEKTGSWEIQVYPKEINIKSGTTEKVNIFVNSTAIDDSVYDIDEIYFYVNATGKTGFDTNISYVSVLREAVEYDLEVIDIPNEIQINHGSSKTFSIVIRNRNEGYISDEYGLEAETEHNLNVLINISSEGEIPVYDENSNENEFITANITVEVPWYSYHESDELKINIFSYQSIRYPPIFEKSYNITIKVITPNILESIYKLFESGATKIGLTGKYAGWILISVVLILLIVIIIIILRFLKSIRVVEIICFNRIKEIEPDETAEFNITIKNPYKFDLNYNIQSKIENDTKGFEISVDKTELFLKSGEEKIINLLVTPNENVKKEDWCEAKIIIQPCNKNKKTELSTITTIKNGKVDVKITGVIHWPKIFKKDDRVETSFKVWNHGNISTGKISIYFYVNGKEKNKIQDVIIPRGGYADIEIPWIADSGKNEVYILVN